MSSATVSFLGPLIVIVDGARVDVPGRGERALLSLLALDVGRPVSVGRLVEALWEEDLPADPINALQLRVSKLRRAVGDLVVTEPSGYRLDLPTPSIDLHRFRALVARRRPHEALGLWRGTPLAEFAGRHWADIEVAALQQEWVHAITDRIDADLQAGRHLELVSELERLVEEHPANERVWAQLMLAQYRSDRQAAALGTFQRARYLLAERFGLDPGPHLLQMEQAILRQDHSLDAVVARTSDTPAPLGQLVGRAAELDRCLSALGTHRLVTVVGPGGVGKSRLALEAARVLAEEYDDGAVVVDLEGVAEPARVAAAVAEAIGTDQPRDIADNTVLASWFRRRSCLLVLDGCEHAVATTAALVSDLLVMAPRLTVLATSRAALGVAGGFEVRLAPLARSAAIELFLQRADEVDVVDAAGGAAGVGIRSDAARAAAGAIVDRVDRLPLAIELAAAWTRSLPIGEIASRLDRDLTLLDHTMGAGTGHRPLHGVVARSVDLLAPTEEALFRQLAVFAGGWSLQDAEAVCPVGEDGGGTVFGLARLVEQSLVIAEDGRFRMLGPVAEVAAARLAASGEQSALRRAHAQHFLDLASAAEERLRGPEQSRWLARLRASAANMAAALAWARDAGGSASDELLLAAAGLGWFWFLGRHGDGRRELAAALALGDGATARARGQALQAQSIVLRPGACIVHPHDGADELAVASRDLLASAGDQRRALLSAVMCEVRAIGGVETAAALGRLATAAERLRSFGDAWGGALADFVAMEVHVQQGDIDDAVVLGERARGGFEQVSDAWGTSSVALHLAHGLRLAGRIAEAVALLEVGREEADRAGIRNTLCGIHVDLARIALHRGDVAATRRSVDGVRSLAEDLGNLMLVGMAEVIEASLQLDRGRGDDARRLLRAAIARFEQEGVPGGLAEALSLCAVDEIDRGDLGAAERHAHRALGLATAMHDRGLEAQAMETLALAVASRGAHTDAATALGRAASVRREGGRPACRTEQAVADRADILVRRAVGDQRFDELVAAAGTAATS